MLFNAGDHVPVMELFEVVGKAASVPPVQIGETAVNVGVVLGVTVTVKSLKQLNVPSEIVARYVVVTVGETEKLKGDAVDVVTTVPPAVRLVMVIVAGFGEEMMMLSNPQLSVLALVPIG